MYRQTGRRRAGPPPPPGPDQPFQLHFSKAMSHAVPSSPQMGLGYLPLPIPPYLNYAGGKKKPPQQPTKLLGY